MAPTSSATGYDGRSVKELTTQAGGATAARCNAAADRYAAPPLAVNAARGKDRCRQLLGSPHSATAAVTAADD